MLSLALAVLFSATSATRLPAVCQSAPSLDLTAGSTVSARIDAIPNAALRCQAVLDFEAANFLPVTAVFEAFQLGCPGPLVAEFAIPGEAPDGPAQITWLCNGQNSPSCSNAVITDGQGDEMELPAVVNGSMGCLTEVIVPVTKTTVLTYGTMTSLKTVTETVRTLTTEFHSTGTTTTLLTVTTTRPAMETTATGTSPTGTETTATGTETTPTGTEATPTGTETTLTETQTTPTGAQTTPTGTETTPTGTDPVITQTTPTSLEVIPV